VCQQPRPPDTPLTHPWHIYLKGGEFMEDLVAQVANVGFPIAVSIYLLVRVESKIESLTVSIYELAKVIEGLRSM